MKRKPIKIVSVLCFFLLISGIVGYLLWTQADWFRENASTGRGATIHVVPPVTSLSTLTITATNGRLLLPQKDSATAPTLGFGDGDTGVYEGADDQIDISIAGTKRWNLTTDYFYGTVSKSPVLYRGAGSATGASYAFYGDPNTGMYTTDADHVALATGGVLRILVESTGETVFSQGIVPDAVTADPCGSGYPEGSIFYNTTANVLCFCDGTNDLKISDGSACF